MPRKGDVMPAVVRWDPFRELTSLQDEVGRLFRRVGGGDGGTSREAWMPSIDVIETGEAIKIKAEMAGVKPEDVSLEVDENVLTLSGERRFEEQVEDGKYYRIERRYGSFSRSIALPQGVDADAIQAHVDDGVLEIVVPKIETAPKRRRIAVAVGSNGADVIEGDSQE
jgi:HSP20 family protein